VEITYFGQEGQEARPNGFPLGRAPGAGHATSRCRLDEALMVPRHRDLWRVGPARGAETAQAERVAEENSVLKNAGAGAGHGGHERDNISGAKRAIKARASASSTPPR
jgi:hypothetical protein